MPPEHRLPASAVSIAVTVDAASATAAVYHPASAQTAAASVTIPATTAAGVDDAAAVGAAVTTAVHTAVAAAGGRPCRLLAVAVPSGWTGRHRDLLRRACSRRGLPVPCIVTRPAALAHHDGATLPGGYLLVVDAGTRANQADTAPARVDLTVLAATHDGFDAVAARETTSADSATVASTARQLLAAADLQPTQLQQILLAAGAPAGLGDALATLAPVATVDTPDALARGALRAADTTPPAPGATADPDRDPAGTHTRRAVAAIVRPQPWYAAAVLTAGLGSLAVLTLTLSSVEVYPRPAGSFLPAGYGGFAAAALLAIQTATSVAALAATAAPALPRRRAVSLLRQAYPAAAGIGLAVAGIYGLFATALLPLTDTPIMGWVLYPCLPVAVLATVTGLAAAAIDPPQLAGWLRRTRPSQIPVLLLAVGMLLTEFRLYVPRPWIVAPTLYLLAGWAGGACLGVAIALTATGRNQVLRAICVVIGAVGVPLVLTVDTTGVIVVAYTLAVAWAWLLTATTTLTTAYPALTSLPAHAVRTLRRLAASAGPPTGPSSTASPQPPRPADPPPPPAVPPAP